MSSLQKAGGISAILAAGTYLFGFVLLFTLLAPAGYGSDDIDAMRAVAFIDANMGLMTLWNLVIYVLNAFVLAVLVLALAERLRPAPVALVSGAFGLMWAVLVLGAGMIANVALVAVQQSYAVDPQAAATMWTTLTAVENGLGGGNEIAGGVWVLVTSLAAWRLGVLPKALNALGLLIGVSGLITVIPALAAAGAVFGLGFIVWFLWVGVALLRG